MIDPNTLQFLTDLKANNVKEWFHEHKDAYQTARTNFLDVVGQVIEGIGEFDEYVLTSSLEPKRCIMRINRDIRFSKDKTPYKTNFFASIKREGKKSPFGGYYMSIDPNVSFVGGGMYMPDSGVLKQVRRRISEYYPQWQEVLSESSFQTHFPEGVKPSGELQRPPQGFSKEDPAIDYLKFKGFYTQRFFNHKEVSHPDFVPSVLDSFRSLRPFISFLNEGVVE